jgi:hypothetical protein
MADRGARDEGMDVRDVVRAGDGGGREERSWGFRVLYAFALSDAVSNSESEFQS